MFRNDTGLPCPVNPRDIAHKHNYALKYLAEGKFGAEFWKSSPGVTVIKQKYSEYLKGIDHRLKVLQETPRKEQERGDNFIVTKDLIQVYQLSKTFKEQSRPESGRDHNRTSHGRRNGRIVRKQQPRVSAGDRCAYQLHFGLLGSESVFKSVSTIKLITITPKIYSTYIEHFHWQVLLPSTTDHCYTL